MTFWHRIIVIKLRFEGDVEGLNFNTSNRIVDTLVPKNNARGCIYVIYRELVAGMSLCK
jgi:hypothetical protein